MYLLKIGRSILPKIKRKSIVKRLRECLLKVTPECIYGLLTLPTQNLTEKKEGVRFFFRWKPIRRGARVSTKS